MFSCELQAKTALDKRKLRSKQHAGLYAAIIIIYSGEGHDLPLSTLEPHDCVAARGEPVYLHMLQLLSVLREVCKVTQ